MCSACVGGTLDLMSRNLTGGPGLTVAGDADRTAAAVASAARLADDSAAAAGVRVQSLTTPTEQHAAAAVLQQVWRHADGGPLPPEMLRAFAFTGNYVGAAFDGQQIVGVACGFRTKSRLAPLAHRGRAAFAPGALDRISAQAAPAGLGAGQRDQLDRLDVRSADPPNAYFNLVKLGRRAVRYLTDFYGSMTDQIDAGDASDRLLVQWDLSRPLPGAYLPTGPNALAVLRPGSDGEPVRLAGSDGCS